MSAYAELQITSNFSFLRGGSHPEELVLRAADGGLVLLLPPRHPYARALAPPAPGWQLPLPLPEAYRCDAHF